VLPDYAERDALGMVIVDVPVKHNDMWDAASPQQKQAILDVLSTCLTSTPVQRGVPLRGM
jgi:hypothetical protein